MHTQNNKFKICKFFLNNKCKNVFKCSFEHLNIIEIEVLIRKLNEVQSENEYLKKEINNINEKREKKFYGKKKHEEN